MTNNTETNAILLEFSVNFTAVSEEQKIVSIQNEYWERLGLWSLELMCCVFDLDNSIVFSQLIVLPWQFFLPRITIVDPLLVDNYASSFDLFVLGCVFESTSANQFKKS